MVLLEKKENIAYIILNRIEKKNALNPEMVTQIKASLKDAIDDIHIRVIVFKSNSDVFSAGADLAYLKSLQTNTYEENLDDSNSLKEMFEAIYLCPKMTVSMVQGHAIAGGCGLATATDFCFSVPEAMFGYTEVKIGFIPALVSVYLMRKMNETNLKELLLTGKLIDAQKAKDMNLIHEVIPSDTIETYVQEFSEKIARTTSSESIANTKIMLNQVRNLPFSEAMNLASQFNAQMRNSDDCKKGIQAFLDKEKIDWTI